MLPVALHMGALHPYEQALTLLLAFGPFVLLAFVLRWRRKQDAQESAHAAAHACDDASTEADATPGRAGADQDLPASGAEHQAGSAR